MTDEGTVEEIARLEKLLQEAKRMAGVADNHSHAAITVNAGGVGVIVACVACALMFGINVGLAVMIANHDRKIDDLDHKITAAYMMAPQLNPENTNGNTNHYDAQTQAPAKTAAGTDAAQEKEVSP
jgi:hypothetical protein